MKTTKKFTIARIVSLLKTLDDKELAKVDRLIRIYISSLKRK